MIGAASGLAVAIAAAQPAVVTIWMSRSPFAAIERLAPE